MAPCPWNTTVYPPLATPYSSPVSAILQVRAAEEVLSGFSEMFFTTLLHIEIAQASAPKQFNENPLGGPNSRMEYFTSPLTPANGRQCSGHCFPTESPQPFACTTDWRKQGHLGGWAGREEEPWKRAWMRLRMG